MKKMNVLIASLMIAGSAQAEPLSWAETPFWKVPKVTEQVLKIRADREGLDKICQEYRSMVVSHKALPLDAEEIHMLRKNDEDWGFSDFSTIFRVNADESLKILDAKLAALENAVDSNPPADTLPAYFAKLGSLGLGTSPLAEIQIYGGAGGLLEVSAKAKLQPMRIVAIGDGKDASFKVYGKDSVCDLFQGKAFLQFDSKVQATIQKGSQIAIEGFYREFETITKEVFEKKSSPLGKAALVGFRTGLNLDRIYKNETQVATQIENLVATFFDQSMNRNSQWRNVQGEARLLIPSAVWTTVKVKAEK